MKRQQLIYRFHDPNPPEVTAEFLFKLFFEINKPKVDAAINAAREQAAREKQSSKSIRKRKEGKGTMSGGRFNYTNDTLQHEIFGWCDTAPTTNVFEDLEITALIWDVFKLIHDFDWYASGDTQEETWLKKKAAFKKRWLGAPKERTKRIIDDSIERLHQELYRTYGVKEGKDTIQSNSPSR